MIQLWSLVRPSLACTVTCVGCDRLVPPKLLREGTADLLGGRYFYCREASALPVRRITSPDGASTVLLGTEAREPGYGSPWRGTCQAWRGWPERRP